MCRFNSIGFKLGHTAIKSAKLVESRVTAFFALALASNCYFTLWTVAAMWKCAAPFHLKLHYHHRLINIVNSADDLFLICIIKKIPTAINDRSRSDSSWNINMFHKLPRERGPSKRTVQFTVKTYLILRTFPIQRVRQTCLFKQLYAFFIA